MWPSILFYNGVIIFSLFLLYISVRINSRWRLLFKLSSFFVLFIVSALRYRIGTDYVNYEKIFELIKVDDLDVTVEPLYYLLNVIAIHLGLKFEFVIAVSSFLFVYPIIKCCDKSVSIWITFYALIYFYLASFNAVRQGVAISISCYALYIFFHSDDKRKFTLHIFIASLFHFSSLFGLIILVIRRVRFPVWCNLSLICLLPFSSLKLLPLIFSNPLFLASKYGFYVNSAYNSGVMLGSGIGFGLSLLPYFIFIVFGKNIFDNKYTINLAINASLLMILVKSLTLHFGFFARVEYSLIFIFAVLFGELAIRYRKTHLNFFLFVYLILWSTLQFELQMINGAHEVVPYESLIGTL